MTNPSKPRPPEWPLRLLRFFLKKAYLEEIEGDLEEIFKNDLRHHSTTKARRLYAWEVVKLLRPILIKELYAFHPLNQFEMFKNNLKIALRIFKSNLGYTFINILGLSTGLAIALLIMLYAKFELDYENYNPLSDRLVRITMDYLNGETLVDQDCETYPPLGPRITSEFSEVVDFTRAFYIDDKTIKANDNYYRESKIYAVDPTFFRLFGYNRNLGNEDTIFQAPHEVILTKELALKYFDRIDVVGETLWISGINEVFTIKGVIPDSPPNTHLKVEMLISYPTLQASFDKKEDEWGNNETLTYLLLSDPGKYESFTRNLVAFNCRLHGEEKILNERVVGQPVKDIHLYSDKSFEAEKNGDATSVFFLLGVAILVIVIAIVNYINLSTAKSLDRAKEIGIRKAAGSSTGQLRKQFFTESFLINLFAGLAALSFITLSLEKFKAIAELPADFMPFEDLSFWFILLSVLLVSTLLSGIFPAVILSSFKPVMVLSGKFARSSKGGGLRKALVVFQFSITIFLLIQTLTAGRQLKYMRQKDLGINVERTIVVRAPQVDEVNKNYQTFKDELLLNSQFQSVTLSNTVPGRPSGEMGSTNTISLVGGPELGNFNFYIYWIDADFIPTMQVKLLAGENYISGSQNREQLIVNEEAIRLWGIPTAAEAINKQIDMWGKKSSIVGVIKNFHQASAKSAHIPMIFRFSEGFYSFASIRTKPGDTKKQLDLMKNIYASIFPDSPFEYFFLGQEYDKQFRADEQFQQVFATLTAFAILIACLGLFGLASFAVSKRTKEIGIRKVLGASVTQIISLLSKDFMRLMLISVIISIPVTYWIINYWLQRYAFKIDLSLWLFAGPAMVLVVISFFTVFAKTFKTSTSNPVGALRDE